VYALILQITIPPTILSLVFFSGIFYKRVSSLEVNVDTLEETSKNYAKQAANFNEKLARIETRLEQLTNTQEALQQDIRAILPRSN
jgi:FtsZ-binding cell division protein ZapB